VVNREVGRRANAQRFWTREVHVIFFAEMDHSIGCACLSRPSPRRSNLRGGREFDEDGERFCNLLRSLQWYFVSNAVSNTGEFEKTMANLSEKIVLRFGEMWTSENAGEQEIWT
jgi:hypothetical protein